MNKQIQQPSVPEQPLSTSVTTDADWEIRMQRAEKQIRSLRVALCFTLLVGLIVFCAGFVLKQEVKPLTVKGPFRVVDEKGKVVFSIDNSSDTTSLRLASSQSERAVSMYVNPKHSQLIFSSPGEGFRGQAILISEFDGEGSILLNQNGKTGVRLSADKRMGGHINLAYPSGQLGINIGPDVGFGAMSVSDESGRPRIGLQASPLVTSINVYSPISDNKSAAHMFNNLGGAHFQIVDAAGKEILKLPK